MLSVIAGGEASGQGEQPAFVVGQLPGCRQGKRRRAVVDDRDLEVMAAVVLGKPHDLDQFGEDRLIQRFGEGQ
ncbi:hypothetical protein [Micromonospora echinospora]|uniref:hypothetical protein n=1 Tax=Micromonospora echinospora TaxID=1877 RepID=UPI0036713E61